MARQTWLASELRAAGLTVVEVDGWKTRGSDSFEPIGVTWHATAGSRTSTAQGEINTLVNGRPGLSGPIAQLMIYRDGTVYVVAAGRCNHNLVGWAGPNKGLGNTALLGIECANDNRGEPWPAVQLDALRRATAVICTHRKINPLKRLAAHYEHQPSEGHPAGATSFKTDPFGVRMTDERPRVAAIMNGDDDMSVADAKQGIAEAFAAAASTTNDTTADDTDWGRQFRTSVNSVIDFATAAGPMADAVSALTTLIAKQTSATAGDIAAALAPAVSATVLPQLLEAVKAAGATPLTAAQVQAAVEAGTRAVLRTGVDAS